MIREESTHQIATALRALVKSEHVNNVEAGKTIKTIKILKSTINKQKRVVKRLKTAESKCNRLNTISSVIK
jgi:hypothetical protein